MISTQEILERLSKMEIFSDIAHENGLMEKLAQVLTKKNFSTGDVIIAEGNIADSLYILLEGDVQVIRRTMHGEQFAVVNLCAEDNVFFGEGAVIDYEKRSASVIALSNCETLVLSSGDFIQLCEKYPLLGYKIIYRIARRLAASLREAAYDTMILYQALLDEVDNPN